MPGVVVGDSLALAVAAFAYDGTAASGARGAEVLRRLAAGADPRPRGRAGAPAPAGRDRPGGAGSGAVARRAPTSSRLQPGASCWRASWHDRADCRSPSCWSARARRRKQHRLNRAARLQNLRGAFALRPGARRAGGRDPGRRHHHHDRDARGVRIGPAGGRMRDGLRIRDGARGLGRPDLDRAAARRRPGCRSPPPRRRGSSRQSRAPRAHHTTRHGLRFDTTLVTRPALLDEDGVDRVRHEEHVDRRRASRSRGPLRA